MGLVNINEAAFWRLLWRRDVFIFVELNNEN